MTRFNSKLFVFFILLAGCFHSAYAGQTVIRNFILKENLLKNKQLAVIAADKDDVPDITANGTAVFSVNGFRQELNFHDGVAVIAQQIEHSTFIYVKVEQNGINVSRLYYVRMSDDDLHPYAISWIVLAIIPLSIVVAALLFRRLILFAVLLLVIIFYVNHQQGLHISTFLETVYDGLKAMITG